jgi:hypothetical protein
MKHLLTLTLLIALPAWGSIHEDLARLARVKAMPEDVTDHETFNVSEGIFNVNEGAFNVQKI